MRAAAALALGAALWWAGDGVAARRHRVTEAASPGAGRPVVAIVVDPGSDQARDSSLRWTADGLARMVADKLLRANDLVVVPPGRTRIVWAPNDSTAATAAKVAARVGATLVVHGVLHREPDGLVLDVHTRDLAHDGATTTTVVADSSSFGLADRVAAHVLATAGARGPGLRFVELETRSVEAYEAFIRGTTLIQTEQPGGIAALDHAIALDSNFVSALFERFQQAVYVTETGVARRLRDRLAQVGDRATERDRMSIRAYDAFLSGRHAVSEAMLRDVIARYPSDPRGYVLLAQVLRSHGKFAESARVLERELVVAGTEPPGAACLTCRVERELVETYMMAGDAHGAVAAALKAVAEHPTIPSVWWLLARAQVDAGQVNDAIESTMHALAMAGDTSNARLTTGRALIVGRRFDDADTVIRALLGGDRSAHAIGYDLRALLERERGQFRASTATIERSRRETGDGVEYEELGNHARLGDMVGVAGVLRRIAPGPFDSATWALPLSGGPARGWSWRLALTADALGERGDTAVLRAIADTLARIGPLSYYARDWTTHHHVRGLVAERAGRWDEAAREFEQALFGRAGFTRTNAELGRAYLALHRPVDALRVLRWAYEVELDAMGRYQPRSELDWLMAQAFAQAGQRDSASTYARYVRAAWAHADPEILSRPAALPP
jgi:predicted Zn-dependent protease